jgi:hypothetical protein
VITAKSPGGLVVATTAHGQLVGLDLDPVWLRTATSRDVERNVGHALRGALTLISTLPERALESCPHLAVLLADPPFASSGSPRSHS